MTTWLNDETVYGNTPYRVNDDAGFRSVCIGFEAMLKNLGLEVLAGPDFSTVSKVTTQATAIKKIYGFKGDTSRVVYIELAFWLNAYATNLQIDIRASREADLAAGTLKNVVMPSATFFKSGGSAPKFRLCVDANRHVMCWWCLNYAGEGTVGGAIEETNTNGVRDGRGVTWVYMFSNQLGSGITIPGYSQNFPGVWANYGVPGGTTADGLNNLYLFPIRPWSLRGEESPMLSMRVGMAVDFSQEQIIQCADYTGTRTLRTCTDYVGAAAGTAVAFLWE